MARQIVLSNGELHVGINNFGLVHDFYFPHVGLENHAAGKDLRHKVGVWIDGVHSWLDDGSWEFRFRTSTEALMGHTRAKHAGLGIILEFDDFVDAEKNLFLRNIHVVNLKDQPRQVRLFLHQAFVIGDSRSNTDTAQYLPNSDSIVHYRGRRVFIVGGKDEYNKPFDQRSIGLFGIEGREGTFRDAEDGELENGTVEHGRVDSTLRFSIQLEAHNSRRVHYWIAAGHTMRQALTLHKYMHENERNLDLRQEATVEWWHKWLEPTVRASDKLPKERRELFIKSAMIIKSHIDKNGAIIASTDTAMLNYSRDAYGYCWPRDGAYALWPLIRLGYVHEPVNFFLFMLSSLHTRGYLMHKYRADGAVGSSWHPYTHGSIVAPPIQEDETALVLFMYAQFYDANPSAAILNEFYSPFVKPMAEFLSLSVNDMTGLPNPSYDLWEEKFLTTTYTTAVVHAALLAAADLADVRKDAASAVKWRSAAEAIASHAKKYLYDEERGIFRKGILAHDEVVDNDNTIDASSFYGSFMFGLFDSSGDELKRMFDAMTNTIRVSGIGMQRYENDSYRRKSDYAPSNPWLITSLWQAQYYFETGRPDEAKEVVDWVQRAASSTGMLSEQVDPDDNSQVSVAPLVWSHAEFMATMLDSVSGDEQ
ncbi:MAG TPA: glycoside hydrolase family 15 protein [Candidatus Saccharimonadales bacterium]